MSTNNPYVERLIAVRAEAISLLQSFPVYDPPTLWQQGWRFQFSNKLRAVGTCNHDKKVISFSQHFAMKSTPEAVTDTLLHEIAHALVGKGHGHEEVWQRKAREIGANPFAVCQGGSVSTAKYKYKIECPDCKWNVLRYRMKQRNFGSRCPNCGTEVEIYELHYTS